MGSSFEDLVETNMMVQSNFDLDAWLLSYDEFFNLKTGLHVLLRHKFCHFPLLLHPVVASLH